VIIISPEAEIEDMVSGNTYSPREISAEGVEGFADLMVRISPKDADDLSKSFRSVYNGFIESLIGRVNSIPAIAEIRGSIEREEMLRLEAEKREARIIQQKEGLKAQRLAHRQEIKKGAIEGSTMAAAVFFATLAANGVSALLSRRRG
jgi:hypothetical protein